MKYALAASVFLMQLSSLSYAQPIQWDKLIQQRSYFELRRQVALLPGKGGVPDLYRGIVAAKFGNCNEAVVLLEHLMLVNLAATEPASREGLESLAQTYCKVGRYADTAAVYRRLAETEHDISERADYGNANKLWQSLALVPPPSIEHGAGQIQGRRDNAGLLRLPATAGRVPVSFVLDTGANLSVLSASTADRLSLPVLSIRLNVASATSAEFESGITVLPEFQLGSTKVRNTICLVLDDKLLSFPQANYKIEAILGMPVLWAIGQITVDRHDQVLLSPAPLDNEEANLAMDGWSPIIEGEFQNSRLRFLLDSGAVSSDLFFPFLRAFPDFLASDSLPVEILRGGAGYYSPLSLTESRTV